MAGSKGIVSAQFYTFSAANRTITFTNDYAGLDLGEITYITNIKNGVATVIYDPFDATKGGTLSGLTLTLAYNTTAMADTDPLQIITGFTPLNADPQPVRIVEGPDQVDDTALLQNISDNLDFLNLALDQSEGIQMNVREVNPSLKDANNATILSDVVEFTQVLYTNGYSTVIDTKGYQSIQFTVATTSTSPSSIGIFPTWLSDKNLSSNSFVGNWFDPAAGSWRSNILGSGNFIGHAPCYTRYFAIQITTGASGTNPVKINITLRNVPAPTSVYMSPSNTVSTNISQINGSAPSARSMGAGGSQSPTIGGIFIAGPQNHGENTVGYPVIVGGREAPYIGNLAGITRALQTDSQGRYILGGDYDQTRPRDPVTGLAQGPFGTAPVRGVGGIQNNIVGAQSLTVSDTNQSEGDTDNMLLKQILQELKILNQQLTEIPFLMNAGQSQMSDPQEYRDDKSTLF